MSVKQAAAQKFLSVPTFADCVRAYLWYVVCYIFIISLVTFIGLLLYSKYFDCDPKLIGAIQKHEQLIIYYVMEISEHIPGISSLLLVTIFCASLSSVSCHLNAVSGVLYKDILTKFLGANVSDKTSRKIVKFIVASCGTICLLLVFPLQHLEDILPLFFSLTSIPGAPVLGMFTLGILFPKANSKGSFYGAIISFIICGGLFLPKHFYQYNQSFVWPSKSLSTEGCENNSIISNATEIMTGVLPPALFRISHFYQELIGVSFTVLMGLIISKATNNANVIIEKELLSPLCRCAVNQETEMERLNIPTSQ